ncbi:MAG: M48 family metallopeptidase [Planctomycetota bacterium]
MANKKNSELILKHLDGKIPPIEKQGSYQVGLMGAAFVMVILLFIYLASLAILCWFLMNLAFGVVLNGSVLWAIFDIFCIVLLGTVFLAMIKPILLRQTPDHGHFVLHPQQEPLLFEYVKRICHAVDAPVPSEIAVDPDVNASASFVVGPFDKEMRLTIGLPLVRSLNTRQLTGVIAHEFGHFAQSSGMKISYFVRSLDAWFATAAQTRDAWDEKIYEWCEEWPAPLNWPLYLIRFAVWVARWLLWGLTLLGHFFVARLIREMEFDADRYETRMVGSRTFAQTCRKLRLMGLCQVKTYNDLDHYRRMDQLPDDFPAMLVDNENHIDEEKFREFEKTFLEMETEWSDTHPCDRERIENAAQEQTDGLFRLEISSTELFSDFKSLSQIVTNELYTLHFEGIRQKLKVKDTDELIAARNVRVKEGKAALRFVIEQFCGYDTFLLPRPTLGRAIDTNSFTESTRQHRDQLMGVVCGYAKVRQDEDRAWGSIAQATCAKRLIEAGFDLTEVPIFESNSIQQAHAKITSNTELDNQLKERLKPFRQRMGLRLIDALEFLRSPSMLEKIDELPEVVDEVKLILQVWNKIIELRPTFESFYFETRVNSLLLQATQGFQNFQTDRAVRAALARLTANMVHIQQATTQLKYPFEHGLGEITLSHFLVAKLPKTKDIDATMNAAWDLDGNLDFLLRRCVGRLGALAEKVEGVFGFEPLETPAEVKAIMEEEEDD